MENFQKYKNPIRIGWGAHGEVYRISDRHVAKIDYHEFSLGTLEKELEISRELFNGGISVPRPEGIFSVKISKYFSLINGFVMEYIRGKEGDKVRNKYMDHVTGLINIEIEKVIKLGFCPLDFGLHNSIYVPKEDRVYLIDFAFWKQPE